MSSFFPISELNLTLTGYIGPDQLSLGQQVAANLHLPFVDLEQELASRAGLSVADIRTYYGETRLKSLETEIVHDSALRRGTVIRIGGRMLAHGDNYERLRATGPVICLTIGLGAMLQRLHVSMGARYHNPDNRALALGELERQWEARTLEGIHNIDTCDRTQEDIINIVSELWRELAIRRG